MDGMTINHIVSIDHGSYIYIHTHHNYCWFKSQLFQYSHHFPISPAFLHDFPMILAVVNAFRPYFIFFAIEIRNFTMFLIPSGKLT